MGITALSESLRMHSTGAAEDPLELLIQLFLLGDTVADVRLLPLPFVSVAEQLGLIEKTVDGRLRASVSLYPIRSVYLISDRNERFARDAEERDGPRVFSAMTPNTQEFLATLPDDPCPAFLEMCAGAGAAALLAASEYAVQAYSYDISERAALFAEFNRRLNGLTNVTVSRGDLYAPAGRQTFDRIVAHPPYVPSLRFERLFRDGGEDGEWLTRRLVGGLPNYLHERGKFYCLCLLAEMDDDPPEARVRRWLRESGVEFDLVLIRRKRFDAGRLIFDNLSARSAQSGDLTAWQSVIERKRLRSFVYASLLLQRSGAARAPLTISRDAGTRTTPGDVDNLLRRQQLLAGQDIPATLRDYRLRAAPDVTVDIKKTLNGAGWQHCSSRYAVDHPFPFAWEGPAWVGGLLAHADGTQPWGQLAAAVEARGVPPREFDDTVLSLLRGGLLEWER